MATNRNQVRLDQPITFTQFAKTGEQEDPATHLTLDRDLIETASVSSTDPCFLFEDSLAVRFLSHQRGSWSPETLPQELRETILSGLAARKRIQSHFGQLRSDLFDARRAGSDATTARSLESECSSLELLATGFVEVREERNGNVSFLFELGRKAQSWTANALVRLASALDTDRAMSSPQSSWRNGS